VLFLIENVPYRLDSRVRRQAGVLQEIGAQVSVISPREEASWYANIEGVHLYQYPKPSLGEGIAAHLLEYVTSLFFQSILTFWIFWRRGFDVIHVANPPDLLWIVAWPYRLLGCRYIFDHHDLTPELYQVRYARRAPWMVGVVQLMERMSIRLADHVISTNETFRRMAIERGGKAPERVTVVRNGPRLSMDFPDVPADPEVRRLGRAVVGYLGIMNPQDHLDFLLQAAKIVRDERGRRDIGFVLVGSGDAFPHLLKQRDELGLTEAVRMTGALPWREVLSTLGAADICVQPDPPTLFNQHLTMNKLMEYMALGKAVVAFDMPETRISGGDAVIYVKPDGPGALADAIIALADDEPRRLEMGRQARLRVEQTLAWEHQAHNLRSVYAGFWG
jgi:glycosyltransferase involved in cell wall biosynthesis